MEKTDLADFINFSENPIDNISWNNEMRNEYNKNGILSLKNFLTEDSIGMLQEESISKIKYAYFNPKKHNVYLKPNDNSFPKDHPRNINVLSSKGCITDDIISKQSPLRIVYNSLIFKNFISFITGQKKLFPYEDKLSSINIHYTRKGEELGWHFDNSSFAITLMINDVSIGGEFEYTSQIRGEKILKTKEYQNVFNVLNDNFSTKITSMKAGGLLLINGKNSMHRVTKVKCNETRVLAVLAYNNQPGVSLSNSAQMTFYGKTDN